MDAVSFMLKGKVGKYITRKNGTTKNGKEWNMTLFGVSVYGGKGREGKSIYTLYDVTAWDNLAIEPSDTVIVTGTIESKKNDITKKNEMRLIVNSKYDVAVVRDELTPQTSVDTSFDDGQASLLDAEKVFDSADPFADDANVPF